jgi:hypothetical protein
VRMSSCLFTRVLSGTRLIQPVPWRPIHPRIVFEKMVISPPGLILLTAAPSLRVILRDLPLAVATRTPDRICPSLRDLVMVYFRLSEAIWHLTQSIASDRSRNPVKTRDFGGGVRAKVPSTRT